MLYGADWRWWHARGPEPHEFRGLRMVAETRDAPGGWPGCISVKVNAGFHALILEGAEIGSGANSGFQAMNLAIRCGAKRILLTGIDCIGSHWHGDHGDGLNNPGDWQRKAWIESFTAAAEQVAEIGVEVVNCSRETAVQCFPRMSLAQAL